MPAIAALGRPSSQSTVPSWVGAALRLLAVRDSLPMDVTDYAWAQHASVTWLGFGLATSPALR